MVAMLVVPAVAARQFADRLALLLPLAGAIGAAIGVAGALLAERGALPTGPVVVLVGFAAVLAAILLAPQRGVLWRARRLAAERREAAREAVLLDLEAALRAGDAPTPRDLELAGGPSGRALRRALRAVDRDGLVKPGPGGTLALTARGDDVARALTGRRALWSLWLEHGWRLELPDAREPDPRDVRGSLGPRYTDRLMALAGVDAAAA
jgi:manganese/zinc/iron transport system permease protein